MGSLALRDKRAEIVDLVLDSLTSRHSRRAYGRAIEDFLAWWDREGRPPLSKRVVQAHKADLQSRGLSPSTVNLRLSAIRTLASEAADNDMIPTEIANGIAKVRGVTAGGVRTGNWLDKGDAQRLLDAPDSTTLKGLRDRAILAVLIGAGLRRSEAASLTPDHLAQREGRWVIVDLVGKRNKVRSIPIAPWVKVRIDRWTEAAGIEDGLVFRAMRRGDQVNGESLTSQGIANMVKGYSQALGLSICVHDLRRTYSKLAHKGGSGIDQIQLSLGHSSVQTTERYLGTEQDLTDAPGDRLGLRIENGD